jgi:hypothetical protein
MRDHRSARMIVPARSIAIVLACATTASIAGAQVAGTVVANAAPLPRVLVSLWADDREIARDTTDAEGRFAFDADVARTASGLALRRLGFMARTLSVRPGDVALRPAMVQAAQPLPAAVVAATRGRSCVRKDDAKARALWDSVRATYATAPRGMGQGAQLSVWVHEVVAAAQVGEFDERPRYDGTPGRDAGWFSTRDGMRPKWESLARNGYAIRRKLPRPGEELLDPEYLHWWYAPLHRELVEHFVEREFAVAHAFTFASATGEAGRTLAFCPHDARRAGLSGTIELDSIRTITRIAWHWITPKPDEGAGAEMLFAPSARAVAKRLVPVRGVYWRRVAGRKDRYYQDGFIATGWYYGDRAWDSEQDRVRP